jgi:hypothetical protein
MTTQNKRTGLLLAAGVLLMYMASVAVILLRN